MTLSEYLKLTGETQTAFADRVGLDQGFLSKAMRGQHNMRLRTMLRIQAATSGKVTPNDWATSEAA